jgi:AcrR family transcriptional regulator
MLQTPTVSVVIATVKADMGYRHTREEILEGALAVALDVGLSRLTFGRVATAMGINDRTVVYYFPTKDDLITEVVMSMGVQLQATLGQAFSSPAAGHLELARAAWPVLARPDADAIFALFFEANGLAAAGRPPFDSLVPQLVEAWVTWVMSHLTGTTASATSRGRSDHRPPRRAPPAPPARRSGQCRPRCPAAGGRRPLTIQASGSWPQFISDHRQRVSVTSPSGRWARWRWT